MKFIDCASGHVNLDNMVNIMVKEEVKDSFTVYSYSINNKTFILGVFDCALKAYSYIKKITEQ